MMDTDEVNYHLFNLITLLEERMDQLEERFKKLEILLEQRQREEKKKREFQKYAEDPTHRSIFF